MSFNPVKLINVFLAIGERQKVGRLALKDRLIYFEYESSFLESRLELSPFKLPLKPGATLCPDKTFEGLFGLFNDSLPDGWGRLLLDRQVSSHGLPPEKLTPLDRLAHVGKFGMGALLYEPDLKDCKGDKVINLDHLAKKTSEVLKGNAKTFFEELLDLSGSSAGARPKIMVGVNENKDSIIHGQHQIPKNYKHWMVKFSSPNDPEDIGAIEYAYSLMAAAAGLNMMPTHLFPAKKGAGYFGVERFDRDRNGRQHIHTVSGLLHADHRLPSLDYEQVLRLSLSLTRNMQDVEKMFRLATFNVFAHNRDDHAKNMAFLMSAEGKWELAPAYDLTFSNGPGGEQSTTVLGEGKSPNQDHLKKLALRYSISSKRVSDIFDEVRSAISEWKKWANRAGVSRKSQHNIAKNLIS